MKKPKRFVRVHSLHVFKGSLTIILPIHTRFCSICTIVIVLLLSSGCATLVKKGLLHAKSYPSVPSITHQIKNEFNIETHEYCDDQIACYTYYYAPNKKYESELKMHLNANFTNKEHKSVLHITRENVPAHTGSVILIHGFRGSKDWSLMSAAYFQFLGFDVYAIDLLGHGDLKTPKGFGVHDVDYIKRFINGVVDTSKPIIAVGNSMGGFVASALAHQNIVQAAILQAPMTQFDRSLTGYFKDSPPWYAFLLPESSILNGAIAALKEVGLNAKQTNTIHLLKVSESPLLIFASNIDNVSPYADFAPLSTHNIEVIEVDKVEHAYMSMIGQAEHDHIIRWLSTLSILTATFE